MRGPGPVHSGHPTSRHVKYLSGVVAEDTGSVLQPIKSHYEDREIRAPTLLIWSQTRCRCAISPWHLYGNRRQAAPWPIVAALVLLHMAWRVHDHTRQFGRVVSGAGFRRQSARAWARTSQQSLLTLVSVYRCSDATHQLSRMHIYRQTSVSSMDTLAEWLRRWPAKPMGSPRVGSNPTGVALF